MESTKKVAEILLRIGAVSLNPQKPFRYASGILSPVYTDCRILISYPKERKLVRDFYCNVIQEAGNFDVIAGTATAGIPHAAFIAEKMKLPMIYIRGKSKDHGKNNQIEGLLEKNQKVAIIEDLISTAESSIESTKAVKAAGGKVSHIFAITTYGMKKAADNIKEHKLKLHTLTTFADIVYVAEKVKLISESEIALILEWAKDPQGWGKKMGFE